MTCFNFFDKDMLLTSFCKMYELDKDKAMSVVLQAASKFDCALYFIEKIGLKVDVIPIDDVWLHCRHITTVSDCFQSLKRYGLITVNQALTFDTPLKRFLAEHDIEIDIHNFKFTYKDKTIYLHDYQKDCISCYYGNCKYHRLNWDGTLDISHKNWCDFRETTRRLSLKLYSDMGEIEVHLSGDKQQVHDYSCVKYYPEILTSIEKLVKEVFKEYVSLGREWSSQQQGKYYLLSFDTLIRNFEHITSSPIFDKHYYTPYFNLCEHRISSLGEANARFYANIYLITKSIAALTDNLSSTYGQLLPSVKITYDEMDIKEFCY